MAVGPDRSARPATLLEERYLRGGIKPLQAIGKCEPRDSAANDDDSRHGSVRRSWSGLLCRLLAADLRLEDVSEPVLDLLVDLVDLFIGKRAIVGLVRE